jgi:hypothetical protein
MRPVINFFDRKNRINFLKKNKYIFFEGKKKKINLLFF